VAAELRSPRHLQVREHSSAGFRERRDQSHSNLMVCKQEGWEVVPRDWPGQGLLSKGAGMVQLDQNSSGVDALRNALKEATEEITGRGRRD
jgi:hypothetical protein